jgi:putative membrane protein
LPRVQVGLIALVLLGVPLSAWGAVYPPNTWLQVGPVALVVLLAVPVLRRWPLSNASVACIVAFLLLHLFAARWTYSDVPYNAWFGVDIDPYFGFGRNMFDRLVHFAFGALAVVPTCEVAQRYRGARRAGAIGIAVMFVLAVGSIYEIFEWLLAVTMDPVSAELYNGQQGDAFDAQKDMAIALLGALGAVLVIWRRPKWWN